MHPFDSLAIKTSSNNTQATLIFTPCPGTKGSSVYESIVDLKQASTDALVTMMPQADLERFEVTDIPEVCKALGIEWFHLPVEDDEAPEKPFFEAFDQAKTSLDALLANGKTVALHCKGGTGRTSLIAAILMHRQGYSWDELKSEILTVRPTGLRIPVHVAFLQTYLR